MEVVERPGFDAGHGSSDRRRVDKWGRLRPLNLGRCRRVVAVAPHLDDEVLGAGSLLQRLAGRGAAVDVLIVTDGSGGPRRRPWVPAERRHRLGLRAGSIAAAETDVVAAISELVGFDQPAGLYCLAPWAQDGHPDHDAVGRAAETVAAAYQLRLVRYLVSAWHWAAPGSPNVPWDRAREVVVTDAVDRRKHAATPTRWAAPVSGSGAREVYLV